MYVIGIEHVSILLQLQSQGNALPNSFYIYTLIVS